MNTTQNRQRLFRSFSNEKVSNSLSTSYSTCQALFLPVSLPLFLPVSLNLFFYLSLSLSSTCLSPSPFLPFSPSLFFDLSLSFYLSLFFYFPLPLFFYLPPSLYLPLILPVKLYLSFSTGLSPSLFYLSPPVTLSTFFLSSQFPASSIPPSLFPIHPTSS